MASSAPAVIASADHGFRQEPPVLGNQYEEDALLQSILFHYLPPAVLRTVEQDLFRLGHRTITELQDLGDNAEAHPPTLTQYDHWCRRIDRLETSEGWRALKGISAEEGLVAIGYERPIAEHSRVYQYAKLYLAAPSMAFFGCPLAMTDGAAKLIESVGSPEMKRRAFERLTSRDPAAFWTSGQWMTERPGGSDVGRTESEAVAIPGSVSEAKETGTAPTHLISGFKWFSSATDSDMAFLLAREKTPSGEMVAGSRGLSLFYAELKKTPAGPMQGIRVHRLKNKLGTHALPTAELELHDLPAQRVGAAGRGVATITAMLTVTRLHSALSSVSSLRRAFAIATAYARARVSFGKGLLEHSLHTRTLANTAVFIRASMHLLFFSAALLGVSETAPTTVAADATNLLRLVTPLLKMFVCHESVAHLAECVEACGGQGYMEETRVARHARDAPVNSIWEGTANILALDVLRVAHKLAPAFKRCVSERAALAKDHEGLKTAVSSVSKALAAIDSLVVEKMPKWDRSRQERGARALGFAMARTLAGALMLEHAVVLGRAKHEDAAAAHVAAKRWCISADALVGELDTDAEQGSIAEDLLFMRGGKEGAISSRL
ncbi:hypothetical protein HDU87_000212 [Geranomyces variabilis]|uniref:Uncharacterized protein n=1 Tax=Geranomyces variabilis TaxID=109894 RepID=A0AAD5TS78_9FUNG|nr:hypothetical protein HDU87_000212 [Geranomyces variabilis]